MTFDDYLKAQLNVLAGYHLLSEWFPGAFNIETPYPPAVLSREQLEELKERLNLCIPLRSMIVDLWDWDIRFEDLLSADWYFETVFGSSDSLLQCATELKEFFLDQVEELAVDYNQYEDPELFRELVEKEAIQFITDWRNNIIRKYSDPATNA